MTMKRAAMWSVALMISTLLIAGAGGTVMATTTAPPAPPAPPATWHWQNPLPHGNSLSAVACPDAHTCYAVGSGTIMVSHTAGHTWSVSFDKHDSGFAALSCPDSLTCYAIAYTGPATTAIVGTKDGGTTWSRLWQGARGVDHLACPQTAICYAIGTYIKTLLMTRDGGQTWTTGTLTFQPVDISCFGANVCFAPLATNLITSPPPSVARTSDGGASWTVRQVGIAKGQAQLTTIHCVNTATCVLIAYGSFNALYGPLALRTDDGGASWQRYAFPRNAPFRGAVFACPSTAICYLAGDNGTVTGTLVTTGNGGKTWKLEKSLPFVPSGIDCSSASHCITTGAGGALLRTDTAWRTRTLETHNAVRGPVSRPDFSLNAVACPSHSVCYAAGTQGTLVKTNNAGESWASIGASLTNQSHGAAISTLTCSSPTVCYAGIYSTLQNRAMVLSTRNGGRSWATKPGTGFTVVACSGRQLCYAGGSRGMMYLTRNGGRTWTRQQTPLTGKAYEIQRLICPTANICYATAMGPSEPPPHPSSNVGALLVTRDGGRTWQRTSTDPFPFALACMAPTDCFALIAGPTLNGIVPELITHNGGRTWTRQTTLPSGYWQAPSCLNRTTCYLVGDAGAIAMTRDAGRTWLQEETPTFNGLEAIRCSGSDSCYAVGQFGTILHGG